MQNVKILRNSLNLLIISALFIYIFSLTANAANMDEGSLPFTLSAPKNTDLTSYEKDSPTTLLCSYEMSDSMSKFFSRDENAQKKLFTSAGMTDVDIKAQIDWSFDNTDSWHYTKYWDGCGSYSGYDEDGNYRLGVWDEMRGEAEAKGYSSTMILRDHILSSDKKRSASFNNWWHGTEYRPGIKKQLRTGTASFVPVDKTDYRMKIDYKAHTVYVRVRWDISYRGENDTGILSRSHFFSDWSSVASYGAGAPAYEPFTPDNIPSPDVKKVSVTVKDKPTAYIVTEESDEMKMRFNKLRVAGGTRTIEAKLKIRGTSSWKNCVCTETEGSNTLYIDLDKIFGKGKVTPDDELLVCCRYRVEQYSYPEGKNMGEIISGYSDMMTAQVETKADPEITASARSDDDVISQDVQKCPVCGICPIQPFGICLFIWAALGFSVLIIIISAAIKEKISRKNP